MASIYHPQLNSLDVKLFGGQEKCARYGGGGRRRQVDTNLPKMEEMASLHARRMWICPVSWYMTFWGGQLEMKNSEVQDAIHKEGTIYCHQYGWNSSAMVQILEKEYPNFDTGRPDRGFDSNI